MIPSTAERGSLLRSKPIGIPSPGRGAHGRARSPVRGAGVPRTAGAPHSSGVAAAARFIAASRSPGAPAHKTRAFRAASAGQAPSTSYGGSTSTSAGGSGSDKLRKRVAGAVARDAGAGAADAGARRRKLYACLALLVVAGAGVQIYMRRALAALHNYSYFVFQSGAIAYFPIVLGVTLFKLAFTKDITRDMMRCKLVPKFALMALLDSLEDFAVIIGTAHTTVALQTLLPQGVLPLTMFFSLLWLKTSYSSRHYIAAGCIIAGVVVVVLPSFSRHVVTAMVGFEILLFSGNIPGALSSVYKQASLQYKRVDVFYLSTWITFFQIIIGFVLTPINSLLPPAEGGVALQNVGKQFSEGVMCLLGHDTITCNLESCAFYKEVWENGTQVLHKLNSTIGTRPLDIATCYKYDPMLVNNGNPNNGLPQCDACGDAWWIWMLFIFFVFAYNVLLLKVVKYGSAAFMYAANAVTLPLVNVLGTSVMVMGPGQASSLNWFTIVGMALALVGLSLWTAALRQREKHEAFAIGSPIVSGQPRFAFNVTYLRAPSTRLAKSNSLARDPMTVRKQLYERLGVSSPGPGRVGGLAPLLPPPGPLDDVTVNGSDDFGLSALSSSDDSAPPPFVFGAGGGGFPPPRAHVTSDDDVGIRLSESATGFAAGSLYSSGGMTDADATFGHGLRSHGPRHGV